MNSNYDDENEVIPEILIAKEQLLLEFKYSSYSNLREHVILDLQPFYGEGYTRWIAITASGCLIRINEGSNFVEPSPPLKSSVDFSRPLKTWLSPNQRFLAIANQYGIHACVVDLESEKVCLEVKRHDYHISECLFPIDFFEKDGKTFLVHATEWNRLDITDVLSGKCVTERERADPEEGKTAEHLLDYFHGPLLISPKFNWILDNGWVWHPVGMPVIFNLSDWRTKNIWESEDGLSKKNLAQLDYWPSSACWIDDHRLAFDGLEDDFSYSTGTRIIDVTTGKTLKTFAGPSGKFFFDSYLFSANFQEFSAWDIETGERVLHSSTFRPQWYHPKTKRFLSLLPNNVLQEGWIDFS